MEAVIGVSGLAMSVSRMKLSASSSASGRRADSAARLNATTANTSNSASSARARTKLISRISGLVRIW